MFREGDRASLGVCSSLVHVVSSELRTHYGSMFKNITEFKR